MKGRKDKKRKHIKLRSIAAVTVVVAVLVTVGFGLFSLFQIRYYESSVLEIYADSQDAYVQLVLEQINLLEDRSDNEIVTKILGTLDSSSNRYWTFSSEETMIFVKDVAETNRYKGFTTSTYYVSEEANRFINNLSNNKVSHDIIPINSKEYVISGTEFYYNDFEYHICLLTNPDTVLEHNIYLNAKINLSIAVMAVLLLFLLSVVIMTIMYEGKYAALVREKKSNEELRIMVERLTASLERERIFDTQFSVFHHSVFPMLMEKLERKKISPVTVAYLQYEDETEKKLFLEQCQIMLDDHVFRFQNIEEKQIIFVTVQCTKEAFICALKPLLRSNIRLVQVLTTEHLK